ncbi:trihelix transcription factor GT-1-like isoform X1 [Vitis riparia]|uniref:trihelix transcription factor GT-1-like isoform X1 n=1 Tax=Vitis riparia TaxID=96939 RepID=UPI00155AA74E|nr:trihelix transcription factor GT-1-like isoform X1 [Vitis riparia]
MPHPMSFFVEEDEDMLMDADANNVEHVPQHDPHRHHPQRQHLQQILLTESSGEDIEIKVPRRRAETWVHDETHSLIAFRRELDEFFNTSKSNKHLWEHIAARMSELGYDRTAAMCTDKWRNLLKDYKKAQQRDGGSGKMYYEELEEFYAEKKRNNPYRKITSSRAPFMHISEKDGRKARFNSEKVMDYDQHSLGISEAEVVSANGLPPWNRKETPGSGTENESAYTGRVIWVNYGECTKRIGIDGSSDSIKEAIRSSFGLRTNRAFWLEDENEIVRSLDRDMPLTTYTLCLDAGLTIKICLYDQPRQLLPVRTEEKTFYCEDDLRDFLHHRGWMGLRDLSCYKVVEKLEDLRPSEMYQGLRLPSN